MNILVIGSGGREHALIWKLSQSPQCEKIFAMPGNGGISKIARNVSISTSNHNDVINFCKENNIEFVMVGPEAPLVEGLVDSLEAANILTFGPSKVASQLEGSKDFTKKACDNYNIPTADYRTFTDAGSAKAYINEKGTPIVIKADGLAAGKGVIIAQDKEEAFTAIDDMLVNNRFGDAGKSVVIEEFLEGEEISVFAICDGNKALYFGSAQDHKAVGEGDTGPNTGGMGTYSPAPVMNAALQQEIMEKAIIPTIEGMKKDGMPYKGVLFAGFMVTSKGAKLLEFNVRFGDPETQVLMARLDEDLLPILISAAKGQLTDRQIKLKDKTALCVVMAAKGYPDSYQKGTVINNLESLENSEDIFVFHAGTKLDENGNFLANGGRVLGITALGTSVTQTQAKAYNAVDKIDWKDGFCRRDIGWRAIKRESAA
ncbi:MAG: phosphoribosylamine--glycine ligase [Alphaproteobacteria bacterium CG11_big_fil_rev_8_21_14_0_20_39_49]|nr:MAG: phosphoribosylamine--glycine ligase [Alphaproteobacteria bacterium CG11_big_fil_rev_8_21_14_0_20_39_49]